MSTDKNICPCCGRQEGVLLLQQDYLDYEMQEQARRGELIRAMPNGRRSGYQVLCNRQCLCCEFEWRIAEPAQQQVRL
ncbi:MAG: hypothetical protein ACRYF5_01975 [Janthinobacterium lividum]